jgi:hypothetical protein
MHKAHQARRRECKEQTCDSDGRRDLATQAEEERKLNKQRVEAGT